MDIQDVFFFDGWSNKHLVDMTKASSLTREQMLEVIQKLNQNLSSTGTTEQQDLTRKKEQLMTQGQKIAHLYKRWKSQDSQFHEGNFDELNKLIINAESSWNQELHDWFQKTHQLRLYALVDELAEVRMDCYQKQFYPTP